MTKEQYEQYLGDCAFARTYNDQPSGPALIVRDSGRHLRMNDGFAYSGMEMKDGKTWTDPTDEYHVYTYGI